MKRTILLVLSVMMTLVITAGDVTPAQALQQAQRFLQQSPTGGKNRSQAVSDLKMTGRVSGLYVFNVEREQGFVIVSNDDRTAPILGYSDSGSLDPDNMPSNMRAWLQGYADEIAWLNAHPDQSTNIVARRASAVKKPIAPLVQTHWNQGAPFNDNCPVYTGTQKAVTGCVATAMAQVMYYHKYANMTAGIAGYSKDFRDHDCIPVGALSATTFDWNNMLLEYNLDKNGVCTDDATSQAAVAKLMQYCGASVKMSYGSTSSSNTGMVTDALKDVFGYNATVQTVTRSFTSYSQWIDLIYHELSEGRPVVYGGQSSGGGHEFVCDGYESEDFFHINWGWGGTSDNYFKLSALDPDQQGIGGSSSSDGYRYEQGAVVGIQKPTDTGSVLPFTLIDHTKITVNSISGPTDVVAGEPVTFTLNITNNNDQDYSGEIALGYKVNDSNYGLLDDVDIVSVPANSTKDCSYTISFNITGTFQLIYWIPTGGGNYNSDLVGKHTITVTEGSSSSSLPTSNNVNLTASLKSLENSNAGKTEAYATLANKKIKAVVTITNPSTTTNFEGYLYVHLCSINYPGWYSWNGIYGRIPAGGSYDFVFEYAADDNDIKDKYQLTFSKNEPLTSEVNVGGTFYLYYGVFAYNPDGTKTVTKAANSYSVPDGALSVDISGAGITTVNKNSNPNTLYILGVNDAVPSGLTNVIKVDNVGNYTAETITLTDGAEFFTPVDFTADEIAFNYAFTTGADGTNGWNTIMLPFNVTSVTADNTAIDWFHSKTDTGKNFWLKEFVSDEVGKVNFDYVSGDMTANTPYIVAFPGNRWGAEHNLIGKQIQFKGENVVVHKENRASVTGGNYRFVGNTLQDATSNIYGINASGNKFVLGNGSNPFRAYFKPGAFDASLSSLAIGGGNGTTGINDLRLQKEDDSDKLFDLQGRRVQNPTKGIYIKNGKKVIIKL